MLVRRRPRGPVDGHVNVLLSGIYGLCFAQPKNDTQASEWREADRLEELKKEKAARKAAKQARHGQPTSTHQQPPHACPLTAMLVGLATLSPTRRAPVGARMRRPRGIESLAVKR